MTTSEAVRQDLTDLLSLVDVSRARTESVERTFLADVAALYAERVSQHESEEDGSPFLTFVFLLSLVKTIRTAYGAGWEEGIVFAGQQFVVWDFLDDDLRVPRGSGDDVYVRDFLSGQVETAKGVGSGVVAELRRRAEVAVVSAVRAGRGGGTEAAFAALVVDVELHKLWVARFGLTSSPCRFCVALHGVHVPLGRQFPFEEKSSPPYGGELFGPPRHVRCGCSLIVVVPDRLSLDDDSAPTPLSMRAYAEWVLGASSEDREEMFAATVVRVGSYTRVSNGKMQNVDGYLYHIESGKKVSPSQARALGAEQIQTVSVRQVRALRSSTGPSRRPAGGSRRPGRDQAALPVGSAVSRPSSAPDVSGVAVRRVARDPRKTWSSGEYRVELPSGQKTVIRVESDGSSTAVSGGRSEKATVRQTKAFLDYWDGQGRVVLGASSSSEEKAPAEVSPPEVVRQAVQPSSTSSSARKEDRRVSTQTIAVPEKAVPEKAVPEKAVPEKAVPEKAVPEKAVPEKAVPVAPVEDSPVAERSSAVPPKIAREDAVQTRDFLARAKRSPKVIQVPGDEGAAVASGLQLVVSTRHKHYVKVSDTAVRVSLKHIPVSDDGSRQYLVHTNGAVFERGVGSDNSESLTRVSNSRVESLVAKHFSSDGSLSLNTAVENVRKLTDDQLSLFMNQAIVADRINDFELIAAESDRREARAERSRAAHEVRAAEIERKLNEGQGVEQAVEEVTGQSVEKQRRKAAISQLRADGHTGVSFDELSRKAWRNRVYDLYNASEDPTAGYLVNPEGKKRGVDDLSLFFGTEEHRNKYMTDELRAYFEKNGSPPSYGDFVRDYTSQAVEPPSVDGPSRDADPASRPLDAKAAGSPAVPQPALVSVASEVHPGHPDLPGLSSEGVSAEWVSVLADLKDMRSSGTKTSDSGYVENKDRLNALFAEMVRRSLAAGKEYIGGTPSRLEKLQSLARTIAKTTDPAERSKLETELVNLFRGGD